MSDEIMKKLNEHDNKFASVDEQFDTLACNVADHTVRLDAITEILVEHTERLERIEEKLENTATKTDMARVFDTLDTIVGLVKKNDQELTFMGERMNRVEKDIRQIKPLVGLAV